MKSQKSKGGLPETYSLLSCVQKNVIVETVKQAEDSKDIVVRLFECMNKQTEVTLEVGFDFKTVYLTNLLEQEEKELITDGNQIILNVKPFEIITLLLKK